MAARAFVDQLMHTGDNRCKDWKEAVEMWNS